MNSRIWEGRILETLDRRPNKKANYVLLRSEQVSISLNLHVSVLNRPSVSWHCLAGLGKIGIDSGDAEC